VTAARALVFDFDGTILDTETPVYESWAETFRHYGAEPISMDLWLQHIGKADDQALDVPAILCERIGATELPADIHDVRRASRNDMLDGLPVRAGVRSWIDAAVAGGIPLAVASSSPTDWVRPHLARLGLDSFFSAVSCADPGIPGKPDPTVYLTACSELGVDPTTAVAIEDSTHGVTAAITAGMRCIASPGPMTTTMDFSHASVRVDALSELDPADWL